jgi:hypothetical protein
MSKERRIPAFFRLHGCFSKFDTRCFVGRVTGIENWREMNSDDIKLRFLQLLTRQYYEVVPKKYRTFCVFNARLLQIVLSHYFIHSELMPCQIWLSRADDSIALGFLDTTPGPGGWDGHVACRSGDFFIDASVYHFNEASSVAMPDAVLVQRFNRPSHVLGRHNISDSDRLWWHQPPDGVDPTPPQENQADLDLYAGQLVRHLDAMLANSRKLVHS